MASKKRLLVVIQEQRGSDRAIEHALAVARLRGADLVVVDVYSYLDAYTTALSDVTDAAELRQLVLASRKEQLEHYLAEHDDEIARRAEVRVLDGAPFLEIIREAARSGCELIVKVSDREGASQSRSFGSTDMHLMRKSPLPVWTVHAAHEDTARRILATVDPLALEPDARDLQRKTLRMAAEVAEATNASLHVLSTWELIGEETMRNSPFLKMDEARILSLLRETDYRARNAQWALACWFERELPNTTVPQWHVIKGSARELIPAFIESNDIELLVMASVAQTEVPGLLIGSTAESVLGDVDCSVLTVKPDGFATPVKLDDVRAESAERPETAAGF